jgi:tRNA 2-thiouridine synthesizing protein E
MTTEITMPDRDAEGYLLDPADWNQEVAQALGQEMDIPLNDDHWDVISFMRSYFDEHQIAADARYVIWHLDQRYPGAGRKRLFPLFPYGYASQACKVAGMRRPRAWSTG